MWLWLRCAPVSFQISIPCSRKCHRKEFFSFQAATQLILTSNLRLYSQPLPLSANDYPVSRFSQRLRYDMFNSVFKSRCRQGNIWASSAWPCTFKLCERRSSFAIVPSSKSLDPTAHRSFWWYCSLHRSWCLITAWQQNWDAPRVVVWSFKSSVGPGSLIWWSSRQIGKEEMVQ